MWKKIGNPPLFFGILWILLSPSFAQDITAQVSPERIVLGESFYYSLEIEDLKEPTPPEIPQDPAYTVEKLRPNVRSSSSITMINGRLSKIENYVTEFRFRLTPHQAGVCKIPPFTYTDQGFSKTLAPLQVQVDKEAPGNRFVQVLLSTTPKSIYIGQPFPITLTILSEKLLDTQNQSATIDAKWIVEFPNFQAGKFNDSKSNFQPIVLEFNGQSTMVPFRYQEERVAGGKVLYKYTFTREFICEVAGSHKIPPTRLKCERFIDPQRRQYLPLKVVQHSNPLDIEIHDAPSQGRPESYSGAIGTFSFKTQIRPHEMSVGEAGILELEIEGVGNIKTMGIPTIPQHPDFKYYEPKVDIQEIDAGNYKHKASILVEIVAKKPGDYVLPPILFTYFDTAKEAYKTLSSSPFSLKIKPEEAHEKIQVGGHSTESSGQSPQILSSIQYIKTDLKALKSHRYWFKAWEYWSFYFLGILLFLVFHIKRRYELRYSNNVALKTKEQAYKKAKASLALEALKPNTSSVELAEIFTTYLSEALMQAPGKITPHDLPPILQEAKLSPALSQQTLELLKELEYSRFGGGSTPLTSQVLQLLPQLEKVL
jgi:hypothetical protein